jgi:phage terminase large subunit GpA-like protein
MTGVEWADAYFFMSSESSYTKGKWKTHPYQVAILNAMCNDEISEVNWKKSARTGYTKLLVITIGYKIEHKNRNVAVWQPDDSARDRFSKTHVDPMIRDVTPVSALFPWAGKKHKNNTIEAKVFLNQKQLHLLGGKAAKNYREISVDDAIYDELSKFDNDVERDGSPTLLGDKRLDGSAFGKSIRGSSPGIAGNCLIDEATQESGHIFKRYVPCIHCGVHQDLIFGGKDIGHGLKWDADLPDEQKPASAHYVCPECGGVMSYADYHEDMDEGGYWLSDSGLLTYDGMIFYRDGEISLTPDAVSFESWAAYSHNSPWSRIVKDWIKSQKSPSKLKTFVNTTLGQTWEEEEGEKVEADHLIMRREYYEYHQDIKLITFGVDTQDDRFEIQFDGWGAGEERWSLGYHRLFGDPSREEIWVKLAELLRGTTFGGHNAHVGCMDHGGHYSDEVNKFSLKTGRLFVIPIKGSSMYGRPVATFPAKPNKNKVYLTEVGTDTGKELMNQRLKITTPGAGYWHFPVNDQFNDEYFKQLLSEKRLPKYIKGKKTYVWDAQGRRNEPWDCSNYSLAACRIAQQHLGVRLESVAAPSQQARKRGTLSKGVVL